jgi:hypothetical protein
VSRSKPFQHKPAEQAREHEDGQDEARPACDPALAVWREAAAGYDHVHVQVMRHGAAPRVQHRHHVDPGAEVLGIGGDRQHRLS